MSLLMARAINQLHPDSGEAVPVVTMGAKQRPAVHAPQACQSITSAVFLPLTDVYLNAFLSELKQIGLDYTVLERRPIRVASVADYRK